jgi:prophage antirepressor-like protein
VTALDERPAVFTFPVTGQRVRTVQINGEPWFVGADVTTILGYANGNRDLNRHVPERHRRGYRIGTPSGDQQMSIVDEPGVYRLIMRSNQAQAETFQDWIAEEVLPSIRKTGSYSVAKPMDELELAERNVRLIKDKRAVLARAEIAESRVAELEPMADLAERYLSVPTGGRLLREVAKSLGWTGKTLRELLVEEGVYCERTADCLDTYWDAKAEHFTGPHPKFRAQEVVVPHKRRRQGFECLHYTLYVLQPGVELILRLVRQAEGDAR